MKKIVLALMMTMMLAMSMNVMAAGSVNVTREECQADEHTWSDWEDLSSTIFEDGGQVRSCSLCGKVEMKNLALRLAVKKTKQLDFSQYLYGKVSYKSASSKIATVSSKGIVKGVKAGSTEITVKSAGDETHAASEISVAVTVPKSITSATLSKTSFSYTGEKQLPEISKINKSSKLVEGTDYQVEWPENPVTPGTYSVKITGIGKYIGTVTKTYKITKASQSIEVTVPNVYVNESERLEPTASTITFSYKSSNKKIATVDADGTIHGVKAGSVYITITAAADDCYNSASKKVKVQIIKKDQEFEPTIDIEPMDDQLYLFVAKSAKITAEGAGKITYSSSNSKIASVSADGTVTGQKEGKVEITVKAAGNNEYNAASKTFALTIIKKYVQSITCDDYTKSITDIGSSFNLEAKVSAADHALSYSSSDPTVVSVDENGNVLIKKAGSATITIITPETDDYYGTVKTVTVNVEKFKQTITYSDIEAEVSETNLPLNAKSDTGATLTYTSSDPETASVDENGNVNPVGIGTCTIKITAAETDTYAETSVEAKVTFHSENLMWNKNKTYRVLMVGNSKTYKYNKNSRYPNICYMVKEALEQQGYNLEFSVFEKNDGKLSQIASGSKGKYRKYTGSVTSQSLDSILKAEAFDVIILQEHTLPSVKENCTSYREAAIKIGQWALAKNPNTAIIVRTGYPYSYAKSKLKYEIENAEYISNYLKENCNAFSKVAYDGNIITGENAYLDKYGHGTYKGNYMVACLIAATLTGEKVTTPSQLCLDNLSKNKMASSKDAYYKLMVQLQDKAWEYYLETKN